ALAFEDGPDGHPSYAGDGWRTSCSSSFALDLIWKAPTSRAMPLTSANPAMRPMIAPRVAGGDTQHAIEAAMLRTPHAKTPPHGKPRFFCCTPTAIPRMPVKPSQKLAPVAANASERLG